MLRVTDLPALLGERLAHLPHSLRLLCENHLRAGGAQGELLQALAQGRAESAAPFAFTFRPNRLLMHDTTCTPALADVAGLRDALAEAGADPAGLAPVLPVDVSVDHSLAVDAFGAPGAFRQNARNEYARNAERYGFLKWAADALPGVRVHPPGTGIMHTLNLEQLAQVLVVRPDGSAHPDMMLGTDSHTPMINGIGVLGWGIGGLEAESVMFGQDVALALPRTVGVFLHGALRGGALATDLALALTQKLRALGVTGCFVEFFGPGVSQLSADARAVVANMAPEYGATVSYFPVDAETLAYLRRTGRSHAAVAPIEPAFRAMGLWFDPAARPRFDREMAVDLSAIPPQIAGPRRPQDTCAPAEAAPRVAQALGRALATSATEPGLPDGAVGIAAITSCTNTSDPALLVAAGLLAQKAHALGLAPKPWVKTSLAPGSPSARGLLERAGLLAPLSAMGFDIVGHGCTTCIGNSGALPEAVAAALGAGKAVAAILSGNRNFPGRVHPALDLAFLASPPLVIAYALKGHIQGDIQSDALGHGPDGAPVVLADIWPSPSEIAAALAEGQRSEDVPRAFAKASQSVAWAAVAAAAGPRFAWDPASRTLRRPVFASAGQGTRLGRYTAQPLMVLGDDITTDHISPAGAIAPESLAGRWLIERGAEAGELNVYASYRGNWEVMLRGLFTNRLVQNHLQPGLAPNETVLADGRVLPLFEAAQRLAAEGRSSVILAGDRYGMGSSRDWAAKGVALLGVRAILARSFERIHRSNLIGMGILPLEITGSFLPDRAGLSAGDAIRIDASADRLSMGGAVEVAIQRASGATEPLSCRAAVETQQEVALLRAGGVLPGILTARLGR
ncbi:aconitate hydratase AcnA [Pseudoruegeria sp. SHC-113]|uniref:aconitate hydratase AcnA n=1 Tax=Pseudoruegeria sp. SHC-113 TaxID=2855439 RepID=UPI0021BA9224|nr:aconitate hydratase AcnA [Pseudoruegeria sp. SHC-113]